MSKFILAATLTVALAACGEPRNMELAAAASTPNVNNDSALVTTPAAPAAAPAKAPAKSPAKAPPKALPNPPVVAPPTVPAPTPAPIAVTTTLRSGTSIGATMSTQLHSRTNKPDELIKASVAADIYDASGRVAIPAGSMLTLRINKLEPSSQQVGPNGRLILDVVSVNVRGIESPISATIGPIPHRMEGRGVTKDEAARVAAGAAAGAVIGQVIGKNTKGTVIGGAIGTAAGAAVAVRYAQKDVVVDQGAVFTITLTAPATVVLP